MKRFRMSTLSCAGALAMATLTVGTRASADITLYDKDGWGFYTKGLVAGHYQLFLGEGDPSTTHGQLVGGQLSPEGAEDTRDNSIVHSRVRSGFIGTQVGFGARRHISDTVNVDSLIAINVYDISSNRGQTLPKAVDLREAWAALNTPYGTFKFGRMFSIFGSASAPVVMLSHRWAIGNPCVLNTTTISCANVGAGPLYAGFDAQLRYISPRVGGLEFQIAASDPVIAGPTYRMTSLPRFDAEVNFDQPLGPTARLRVIGQGVFQQSKRIAQDLSVQTATVTGVIGSAILDVGGFSVGGGAWTGNGLGFRTIMEATRGDFPLAYDSNGELRRFRGMFGNVAYDFHGTTIAVGGGSAYARPTTFDIEPASGLTLLVRQIEYHAVLTQKIDAVMLSAEYMRWHADWYFGEKRDNSMIGVGANFFW